VTKYSGTGDVTRCTCCGNQNGQFSHTDAIFGVHGTKPLALGLRLLSTRVPLRVELSSRALADYDTQKIPDGALASSKLPILYPNYWL